MANIFLGNQSLGGGTRVKGSAESTYREGDVNITPANLGITVVNNTADSNKSVKYATSAGSATKATLDSNGNNIVNTYATKSQLSGYVSNSALSSTLSSYATKSYVDSKASGPIVLYCGRITANSKSTTTLNLKRSYDFTSELLFIQINHNGETRGFTDGGSYADYIGSTAFLLSDNCTSLATVSTAKNSSYDVEITTNNSKISVVVDCASHQSYSCDLNILIMAIPRTDI